MPIIMRAFAPRLPVAPGQHVLIRDPSDETWCLARADPAGGNADHLHIGWIANIYDPPGVSTGDWSITTDLEVHCVEPHEVDAIIMAAHHLPGAMWYDWCATFTQAREQAALESYTARS